MIYNTHMWEFEFPHLHWYAHSRGGQSWLTRWCIYVSHNEFECQFWDMPWFTLGVLPTLLKWLIFAMDVNTHMQEILLPPWSLSDLYSLQKKFGTSSPSNQNKINLQSSILLTLKNSPCQVGASNKDMRWFYGGFSFWDRTCGALGDDKGLMSSKNTSAPFKRSPRFKDQCNTWEHIMMSTHEHNTLIMVGFIFELLNGKNIEGSRQNWLKVHKKII